MILFGVPFRSARATAELPRREDIVVPGLDRLVHLDVGQQGEEALGRDVDAARLHELEGLQGDVHGGRRRDVAFDAELDDPHDLVEVLAVRDDGHRRSAGLTLQERQFPRDLGPLGLGQVAVGPAEHDHARGDERLLPLPRFDVREDLERGLPVGLAERGGEASADELPSIDDDDAAGAAPGLVPLLDDDRAVTGMCTRKAAAAFGRVPLNEGERVSSTKTGHRELPPFEGSRRCQR